MVDSILYAVVHALWPRLQVACCSGCAMYVHASRAVNAMRLTYSVALLKQLMLLLRP
jgi:hypothetical protein